MDRRLLAYVTIALGLLCLSGSTPSGVSLQRTALTSSPSMQATGLEISRVIGYLQSRHTTLVHSEIARLAPVIVAEARGAELELELILALIDVESSGNNFALSHVGAMGLMQLRPTTAEAVANRIGVDWQGPVTLLDPVANVQLGVSYLASLVTRFGDLEIALAAYNAGPTRVAAHLRNGRAVPAAYTQRILSRRDASSRSRSDRT